MTIQYEYDAANKTLSFMLTGRLGFSSYQEFSGIYQGQAKETVEHYVLDMSALTYLDSSALGMLLLLKDYSAEGARISIMHCSPDVYKILEIANFHQLFTVTLSSE